MMTDAKKLLRANCRIRRLQHQIKALRLANAEMRLRLSRWGRPTKAEQAARAGNGGPEFSELTK